MYILPPVCGNGMTGCQWGMNRRLWSFLWVHNDQMTDIIPSHWMGLQKGFVFLFLPHSEESDILVRQSVIYLNAEEPKGRKAIHPSITLLSEVRLFWQQDQESFSDKTFPLIGNTFQFLKASPSQTRSIHSFIHPSSSTFPLTGSRGQNRYRKFEIQEGTESDVWTIAAGLKLQSELIFPCYLPSPGYVQETYINP